MTKSDKVDIQLMLQKELKPVHALLQKHEQTVFGAQGTNGLYGDNKKIKGRLDNLEASKNRVYGAIAIATPVVSAITYFLINLFKGAK